MKNVRKTFSKERGFGTYPHKNMELIEIFTEESVEFLIIKTKIL